MNKHILNALTSAVLTVCLLVQAAPVGLTEAEEIRANDVEAEVLVGGDIEDTGLYTDDGDCELAQDLPEGEPETAFVPPEAGKVGATYSRTVVTECPVCRDDALMDVICMLSAGEAVLVLGEVAANVTEVAFDTPEGMMTGFVASENLTTLSHVEAVDLLDELATCDGVALYDDDLDRPLPRTDAVMKAANFTAISNNQEYTINGVTIKASMVGNYGDCWSWARQLYYIIWGVKFTTDWQGNDATGRNLIRNLTDAERQLTGENLKSFIGQAALGCTLRIGSCPSTCGNFNTDGCPNHEKHSLIVVDKDENGMVVMDNMTGNGTDKYATRYYTWESFASHWARYKMIK